MTSGQPPSLSPVIFHAHHALSVLRSPEVVVELDRGLRCFSLFILFRCAGAAGRVKTEKKSRMTVRFESHADKTE